MKRVLGAFLFVLATSLPSSASERHFTYTYESSVLRAGGREIEPWNTFRLGRDDFYARLDTRLETELGLTDRLQTSVYLNLSARAYDTPQGRQSSTTLAGVSSEWKLKLKDPVADPVGLALYGELSGGPEEAELEAKLILDKRAGRFLTAFNLSAEHEWEFAEAGLTEHETKLELVAGGCYFVTPGLTAGLELFLGPSLSYSREGWWVAASVLPQLRALSGATSGHLDLAEHEKVELRFLFGVEF
jgi:hypothetical protein